MIIDGLIRDKNLQYYINRDPAQILALSSWRIDKYEYLTVKKCYILIKEDW